MILKNFHRDYFKRFFLQENVNNFTTVMGPRITAATDVDDSFA